MQLILILVSRFVFIRHNDFMLVLVSAIVLAWLLKLDIKGLHQGIDPMHKWRRFE